MLGMGAWHMHFVGTSAVPISCRIYHAILLMQITHFFYFALCALIILCSVFLIIYAFTVLLKFFRLYIPQEPFCL